MNAVRIAMIICVFTSSVCAFSRAEDMKTAAAVKNRHA